MTARSSLALVLVLTTMLLVHGCGGDDGGPVAIEDQANVQALFTDIGADFAELLTAAAGELGGFLTGSGSAPEPASLASCPDGGTVVVAQGPSSATFTSCALI